MKLRPLHDCVIVKRLAEERSMGRAKRIEVGKEDTTIIDGAGEKTASERG